jgi:FlaA1/EpsC-like NDP-sugar epimerase
MARVVPTILRFLLDLGALATVFVLSFLLRFDWNIPHEALKVCVFVLPYVVVLKYAALYALDVPKFAWRYVGLREATRIFEALAIVSALLLVVRLVAPEVVARFPSVGRMFVPATVLAMDFVLSFCAIVGLRSAWRVLVEQKGKRQRAGIPNATAGVRRTILVGAGSAGLLVVKEAEARPDLGVLPVGFVDDDLTKMGTMVHGIPVLGATAELTDIAKRVHADQVLVTMADAPGSTVRRLVRACNDIDLVVKIIPGIHEIVDGRVSLSRARDVAIDDLLGRDPVKLDESAIAGDFGGKVVLVTGAGGSIGSELCRQLCRFALKRLVLVEQAENALFEIHRELIAAHEDLEIIPVIGDITDRARMQAVFREHRPRVVLHAAAHKHVPMMEWNPGEAVKNNVFGTKCVADLAGEFGAERFVMISTDKAVNPTSIMGATKRVAELYIQALSARSATRYVAVRFGNVLGSTGSVIPIFRQQIARGGPVTVTHREMRRYFMTIPEASQLVIQAATMGKGGEIFILDMGEPVYVYDLARDMIELSGLKPGEDIEIQITGTRPGEKLFEELSVANEAAEKTYHPKIFVGRLATQSVEALTPKLEALDRGTEGSTLPTVRRLLQHIVPEYIGDGAANPPKRFEAEPERTRENRPSFVPAIEQG